MDDLLNEFLTETNEGLATLDVELVKLEQNPNDQDLLGNIFRLMHTIKGTCGFLGLPRLESVAHAGENVLGKIRDGELDVGPEIVSVVLECLDRIREILSVLEQTEAEPEGDDTPLIARLDALAGGGRTAEPAEPAEPAAEAVPCTEPAEAATPDDEGTVSEAELEAAFQAAPGPGEMAEAAAPEPSILAGEEPVPATAGEGSSEASPGPDGACASAADQAAKEAKESSVANQSIRVNVEVLEHLMTMVSELVLTRNQLLQILRSQKDSEFTAPLQRLSHVVSELQEGVMQTRMQPIGNAWAKLPRIVRDLSLELNKKIELVMKGAETELDRQVLDLIKDPLTHMVRNSADHGLELPADRAKAGKPETGTIILNAFHEGGHIIIEISDDGRGLSVERIKQKCIENGLASEAEIASMTEQQIQQHIFKAGFSTAQEVTAVSGRGVGMDVVRTNIEKIGGTIELSSLEGRGTKFTIKIPLTLAIISALIVECGGERFAIPQLSVVELVRASRQSEHSIERINETPVLRLRNRLLPLVSLRELLELDAEAGAARVEAAVSEAAETAAQAADGATEAEPQLDSGFIVVTQIGNYRVGIIVDRVFDTEEIVVKPVSPILRNIQLFSGNTILGDGSVVMILDPNGIAATTGEITVTEESAREDKERLADKSGDKVSMIVFKAIDDAPKAVPLALVTRLEEIDLSTVEVSNNYHVVQYRGHLMPLIRMDRTKELAAEGRQPVLVFSDRDRMMGLVVDEILDIVDDSMNVELSADRDGFIGTAVIADKATDIIDASYYLTQAFHDWFGNDMVDASGEFDHARLLLVDDSPFFRNLLHPLLAAAGYRVTAVDSATAALELCKAGEDFDVIISDIEMPGMSGFEFAEAVKGESRWKETPLVALSAFSTPKDMARGRSVGFKDYVAKTDRYALLNTIQETINEIRGAA